MSIISVCAVCVFSIITICLFKQYSPAYAVIIALIASAVLLLVCLAVFHPVLDELYAVLNNVERFENYFASLIKCVGISYLADFTSRLCDENGGKTLTLTVNLFSRLSIILICLPYISDILKLIEKLMSLK